MQASATCTQPGLEGPDSGRGEGHSIFALESSSGKSGGAFLLTLKCLRPGTGRGWGRGSSEGGHKYCPGVDKLAGCTS